MWIYKQDIFFIIILKEYFLEKNIKNKNLEERNIILYLNKDFYFLGMKHEIKMRFLKIIILWNLIYISIIVNFNSE